MEDCPGPRDAQLAARTLSNHTATAPRSEGDACLPRRTACPGQSRTPLPRRKPVASATGIRETPPVTQFLVSLHLPRARLLPSKSAWGCLCRRPQGTLAEPPVSSCSAGPGQMTTVRTHIGKGSRLRAAPSCTFLRAALLGRVGPQRAWEGRTRLGRPVRAVLRVLQSFCFPTPAPGR